MNVLIVSKLEMQLAIYGNETDKIIMCRYHP